jgi:hypothetical protein
MIEIHTLKWREDHAVHDGDEEDANITIYCRVFIDGKEIPGVARARTYHRDDFTQTTITMYGMVEMVNHTRESWDALDAETTA